MHQKGTFIEGGGSARSTFVSNAALIATLQRKRTWIQERRGEDKATYPCAKTSSTMGCQWRIRGGRQNRYRRQKRKGKEECKTGVPPDHKESEAHSWILMCLNHS